MTHFRSIVLGVAALAVTGSAFAQAHPPKAAATQARPAAPAASDHGFADENDPTLPRRGSEEDCRNWRIEYANSQACFAPYRNATGGIKAEAFRVCGPEVLDPSPECGVPRAR